MNTPKWDFRLVTEKNVYEPAEDTFFLLDVLETEIGAMKYNKPLVIMEIGSGSGVVIAALSNSLNNSIFPIAVDISIDACIVTKSTSQLNNVSVDVVHTNLLEAFKLCEMIDIIVFNPPYVQTDDDEIQKDGISRSWAGGTRGRRVLDRLLPNLNKAMSQCGSFYLVAIDYNDIEDIMAHMKLCKLDGIVLQRRQIQGESLYVLKFTKMNL